MVSERDGLVFKKSRFLNQKRIRKQIYTKRIIDLVVNLSASFILVIRNFFLLIFYPYKTMRKLSLNFDYYQLVIIFLIIFSYFKFAYFLKDKPYPATVIFLIFLINFFLTIGFFYFLARIFKTPLSLSSFLFTFSYSLFPTLIWFGVTSILYIMLPPPRTMSILGRGFSIFFIAFSLSLLAWKIILVFLSLRFSLRLSFYQIVYFFILYLLWFLPYSILLYYLRFFRIPFI